ncbi:MAG TPA: ATP-dependent DNA helicase [Acidimicrobiia bacterium]|nr:ATP-dependent DNA helicase [Acidimicrobiia bacterium]
MSVTETRLELGDWDRVLAETDGPQIVVAGPGTGKTEFLVRRVARIIETGAARRDQVAMLTFSRRAAADVRRRIDETLGGTGMPIDVSTFHSLALRLLEAGSDERPIPLTSPEQVGVVGELLAREDPSNWPIMYRGILAGPAFAAEVADFLMRCSERLLSPDELEEHASARADWRGIPGLYRRYRETLEASKRTDYGTMLVSAVALLRSPPGQELADGYRYVVVDEYQDTSPVQAEIARLLALPSGNLTVAGDPYQSIYSFRGAELRNIARFPLDHPDTHRIVLRQSLRVPTQILESALRIVSSGELPGSAGPVEPASHTGRVETYVFDQETAEAEWIARDIEHAIKVDRLDPSSIAVLVRSKREMLAGLSRALTRKGIPHDPPESRLVEHPAVRMIHDLVTIARLGGAIPLQTPGEAAEADRAMRRILLGPLVASSLGKEREILRVRRRSRDAWPGVLEGDLPSHPGLIGLINDPEWWSVLPAVDGFWEVWTRLDDLERIILDPDRRDWRLAFNSFSQVLERQAERDPTVTLARLFELTEDERFESTPLLSHRSTDKRVTLTTLHQAKGLEFDVVFLANAVEGVFPDLRRGRRMLRPELLSPERTTDPEAQHLFQVQEEMRLAYTAMTRARLRVVWTATSAGVDQGERRPSRFLAAAADPKAGRGPGPPVEAVGPPVTLAEAQVRLRRTLLDPVAPPQERLAAAQVLAHPKQPWWSAMTFAGVASAGPDSPILGTGLRLSPSQADAYASCPRQYAMERRLRLSDSSSSYAHFGTLVHTALEAAESETLGSGKTHADLADALSHLERVWATADFGTPQLNAAWLKHAREAISNLYTRWPSPDGIPVELEKRVEAVIGGVPWIGYIDRLERTSAGLRVIDYKTTKSPPTHKDAKQSIQLGFYAAAVSDDLGEPVIDAQMWFPRSAGKSVGTRALDMSLLPQVRETMEDVTSSIREENWEPRVSARCERCRFRLSCPAWPQGKGAYLP